MDASAPTETVPAVQCIPDLPMVNVEPAAMSKPVAAVEVSLPPTGKVSGPATMLAAIWSSFSTPFQIRTSSNSDGQSCAPFNHGSWPSVRPHVAVVAVAVQPVAVTVFSWTMAPDMALRMTQRTAVSEPFFLNVSETWYLTSGMIGPNWP